MTCAHAKTVTSDLRPRVSAKVTICTACGATVDYRELRSSDATGPGALPEEEREIQARVKVAKAEEVKAREESEETEALLKAPVEAVIAASAERVEASPEAKLALLGGEDCSSRGGGIPACDTGYRQAHHCRHSKWGKLRTFEGPCRCLCHSSPRPGIPT